MNRDPYLPLTETSYYTLVALLEPCHGYKILNKVKELSDGQVHLAPGTLYGALENLEKQSLISLIEEVGPRKKVFQITEKGLDILKKDQLRLIHMSSLLRDIVNERPPGEKASPKENKNLDQVRIQNKKKVENNNPKEKIKDTKPVDRNKIKKKNKEEDLFY